VKTFGGFIAAIATSAVLCCLVLGGCTTSSAELLRSKQEAAQQLAQQEIAQRKEAEQAKLKAQVHSLSEAAAKEKAAKEKAAKEKAAKEKAAKSKAQAAAKKAAARSARIASCGGNLSVGPNTTCSFALNVQEDYLGNGGGSGQFYSFSPVTQKYYLMTCRAGVPTVCRGGNDAVVYIR
jgi:hypothetical protein